MARKRNFESYEKNHYCTFSNCSRYHYLGEVKLCVGVVVIIIRINELKRNWVTRSKSSQRLPGHCCRWPAQWSWAYSRRRPSPSSATRWRCPRDSWWPWWWAPWPGSQTCRRRSWPWCSKLRGLPPCPQGWSRRWLTEPVDLILKLWLRWPLFVPL